MKEMKENREHDGFHVLVTGHQAKIEDMMLTHAAAGEAATNLSPPTMFLTNAFHAASHHLPS